MEQAQDGIRTDWLKYGIANGFLIVDDSVNKRSRVTGKNWYMDPVTSASSFGDSSEEISLESTIKISDSAPKGPVD